MYRLTHLTRVAAIGAVLALAACETKRDILMPSPSGGNSMFQSYVALGNSITAGFQSNGINDSTQAQSFARLLAGQMGTQYHFAALNRPGCPPPIANTQTGALVTTPLPPGTPLQPCYLRAPSSVTDILNNVAVPGARVLDPTSPSTVASNALTALILGGKTQVARALDAHPTFATIWIGNNDVLQAGLSGFLVPVTGVSPGIVSTPAQFQTAYDAMIKQLTDSAPGIKGVLIGVVQVAGAATMSAGDTIFKMSPQNRAILNAATGKTVTIDASCSGSTALVDLPQLIPQIRSGAHPAVIACAKGIYPAPVGDIFVLDDAEQATLKGVIDAYNAYIKGKADAIGFAYYDPNPQLAAQRATNAIPRLPNFASATATFGTLISLDGIHPAGPGHKLLANDLIATINTKYGTSLAPVP